MKLLSVIFVAALLFSCSNSTTSKSEDSAAGSSAAAASSNAETDATQTKTLKLKSGDEVSATVASAEELSQAKSTLEAQGVSSEECCGQEACINGYIWSCSRGNDDECRWYKSDWKCNSDH